MRIKCDAEKMTLGKNEGNMNKAQTLVNFNVLVLVHLL